MMSRKLIAKGVAYTRVFYRRDFTVVKYSPGPSAIIICDAFAVLSLSWDVGH